MMWDMIEREFDIKKLNIDNIPQNKINQWEDEYQNLLSDMRDYFENNERYGKDGE